jgi:hypothetical protein
MGDPAGLLLMIPPLLFALVLLGSLAGISPIRLFVSPVARGLGRLVTGGIL